MISRRPSRSRRGTTTVEMAFCMPVFLLVIFFFIEAWRFLEMQQAIDQAAYEGARAAVVPGATAQDGIDAAENILRAVGANTATVDVTPDPITDTTNQVTVAVALNYEDVSFFFAYFTPGSILNSTLTLDHENQRIARQNAGAD